MADSDTQTQVAPFEMIGGRDIVRRIVDRFYDLMDSEPDFAALRALHAPDLRPMRTSLTGYLVAWLGGPRDWFVENPGKCVMSAHQSIAVSKETAQQWSDAMRRAIGEAQVEPELTEKMASALDYMASGMAR
jgi:hemoglobin